MKVISRLSKKSKLVLGTVVVAVAATTGLLWPTTGHALLGGDRQTKVYSDGVQGFDHVQFNSFTNSPNIGDERNFMTGMIDGANGGFYDPMNGVRSGDELLVRVYVHNNADSSLNASGVGIAHNTKVRVVLPTGMAQNQTASAFISADNATPQSIEDTLSLTGETPVGVEYVPGSANITTNFMNKPLSDNIVKDGVLIGDDNLNGDMRGCFHYTASVTFKVKITAPNYSLTKKVRVNGTSTFTPSVTAKPGDKLDFSLAFKNTGTTTLNTVVLGDRLPVGLTYVPGSSQWFSSLTGNKWAPISDDWITKGGGSIGSYAPGASGFITFSATVDNGDKLQCGMNRIINFGFAHPENQGAIQSSAEVDVTKQCATPTPTYSCDLLDLNKGDHTVAVKTFNTTATNGATFKNVVIDWGDGTSLMTDKAVGQTHNYTGNGPFTVKATPHFTVNNADQTPPQSNNCVQTVSFTTPAQPTVLPNTGAGNIAEIFGVTTVLGAVLHRIFGRRFAR